MGVMDEMDAVEYWLRDALEQVHAADDSETFSEEEAYYLRRAELSASLALAVDTVHRRQRDLLHVRRDELLEKPLRSR